MDILLVTQYYLPQPLANAEVISGLARRLGARGHEVTVVSPVRDAPDSTGVTNRRAFGTFAEDRSSIPARLLEYGTFSIGALRSAWRAPRPDVVLVPSPPLTLGLVGDVIARHFDAPLVYNVQDIYPEVATAVGGTPGSLQRVLRHVAKYVYRRSAAVVVIDPAFISTIAHSCPNADVRAVRNGIDTAPFQGAARDDAWLASIGVPAQKNVVMYAGNIGRSQDLVPVIDATRRIGAALVIHGGGAGLESLRADVESAGEDHVHFSGYVRREMLGNVFASADLHVVPLKPGVGWASVPSKLLSIFSAGRPVVLAAELDSPAADIVREADAGWIVPCGQPERLAEAIDLAFTDPDLLTLRGTNGAVWAAANADTEHMATGFEAVLNSLVHKGSQQ